MKLLSTLTTSLLLFPLLAGAQGTITPVQPPAAAPARGGGGGAGTIAVNVGANTGPGSVKGAPFSADVITETNHQLADGNRLHQELHGKMFRDSEGRTRNESEFAIPLGQIRQHIFIFDPVERLSITLDVENKTAIVNHFQAPAQAPEVRRQDTKPSPPSKRPSFDLKSESLGSMQIEGFNVTGTRSTRTVAAGEMGNDKPLVTVTETWFSTDLHTALSNSTDDPLSGQTTRKLVNIRTDEPDPLLFQVPPDYTVKDNAAPK